MKKRTINTEETEEKNTEKTNCPNNGNNKTPNGNALQNMRREILTYICIYIINIYTYMRVYM